MTTKFYASCQVDFFPYKCFCCCCWTGQLIFHMILIQLWWKFYIFHLLSTASSTFIILTKMCSNKPCHKEPILSVVFYLSAVDLLKLTKLNGILEINVDRCRYIVQFGWSEIMPIVVYFFSLSEAYRMLIIYCIRWTYLCWTRAMVPLGQFRYMLPYMTNTKTEWFD